jgi:hypothetical protein
MSLEKKASGLLAISRTLGLAGQDVSWLSEEVKKLAELTPQQESHANRLDDVGIAALAAPAAAGLAGSALSHIPHGATADVGRRIVGAAEHFHGTTAGRLAELGGLALVAPGIGHALARRLAPEKTAGLAHARDSGDGLRSKSIATGAKVEMEHTNDPATARQISIDHLRERGDYYKRLKKVEGEGKTAGLEALRALPSRAASALGSHVSELRGAQMGLRGIAPQARSLMAHGGRGVHVPTGAAGTGDMFDQALHGALSGGRPAAHTAAPIGAASPPPLPGASPSSAALARLDAANGPVAATAAPMGIAAAAGAAGMSRWRGRAGLGLGAGVLGLGAAGYGATKVIDRGVDALADGEPHMPRGITGVEPQRGAYGR